MDEFKTIKELYTPVQPKINFGDKTTYTEIKPALALSNFIYCYWQLKTNESLHEDFTYKVVSDGCMDIFWETKNSHQNFITGFSNQYTEFLLENEFNYFGIRFLPTAFPILFKTDASKLKNRFEDLQSVIPTLSKQLKEQIGDIDTLQKVKPKLDHIFLKHLENPMASLDQRLYEAIDLILKSQGTLSIENDLKVGISPRQLRRLFNFYIGSTPKTFSKVVRFQSLLKGKPSSQSLRKNKLYYDLGYFDQAHFIKEFKHLFGTTPSKAFK